MPGSPVGEEPWLLLVEVEIFYNAQPTMRT